MTAIYPLHPALQTADVIARHHSCSIQRVGPSAKGMRLKGKSRFASIAGTLPCLLAIAAVIACAPAKAQDTSTAPAASEPAPVLRGFRLDPKPSDANPPPPTATVPPPTTTPNASPTTTPKAAPQTRASQEPRTKAAEPVARATPDASTSAPDSQQDVATPVTTTAPESPAADTQPTAEAAPIDTATPASDNGLWWKLGAALAALAFVTAGIWWLRRQSGGDALVEPQDEISERPADAVAKPIPAAAVPATAPVQPVAAKPAIQKPAAEAPVLLEFIPDRAVISLANLSLSGQLRLTNRSDEPVENLRLRAGLIGASANQAEIISAFHNRDDGSEKPLADLKPGERRAFSIDMALPLADMPSYVVGAQRLLVPIVVANLAYGKGRTAPVELACMIGREANPPQPKLGPLRLDLGPRSFSPLGQRQLAA